MLVYVIFTAGLIGLMLGGDWLVKGSVGLAEKLNIPPLIIGLTIVAFGTSAPELVISLKAALSGSGGLAVGNVVGSNIANVLLVLGVPALIATINCEQSGAMRTLTFLVGVTLAFMLQLAFGPVERIDGFLLLVCLAAFLFIQFRTAKAHRKTGEEAVEDDYHDEIGTVPTSNLLIAGLMIAGLIALPIGASVAVDAAVEIAERWAVPHEIIGLTIVAIGTSLPELATGIMAARQGNASVALGNVIGSNFFNIAAIMGITALVAPVPVGDHIIHFDMWVMLATTLLLVALTAFHIGISKGLGLVLTLAYAAYLLLTVLT